MGVEPGAVLVVTPRWVRDGGVATHAMASAAELAARGVQVSVLTEQVDRADAPDGVTVHVSDRLLDERAAPEARVGDALDHEPQLVHMHQLDDPDLVAFLRARAPVAISVHGYSMCTSGVHYFRPGQECPRAHGPGCVPNLLLRGCAHTRNPRPLPTAYRRASRATAALRMADLAISYSHVIDRHLADNGVARRAVLPLFTTIERHTGSGHAARRRVVFAGRIVAMKGVGVLLHAARSVDAEFVVCGDGWQLDAMRRLAQRLGLEQRVEFRGWLAPEELAVELADASVVVMPSLWPEPFGLVGLEALAAGRPVIASDTGGVTEWLEDGVTGIAVAPGDARALADALTALLADPGRQRELGAAGRELVGRRFTAERHTAELLDAYRLARREWSTATAATAASGAGASSARA